MLPQSLTDLTRPITKYGSNFLTGFIHGFTNYNLDLPFFCIVDGPSTFQAYLELDAAYQKTNAADIYQNVYDVGLPLRYNCNPLTAGGNLMSAFYVLFPGESKSLFSFLGQQLIYLPILVGAIPNFLFDVGNLNQVVK